MTNEVYDLTVNGEAATSPEHLTKNAIGVRKMANVRPKSRNEITQEHLKSVLCYDPASGEFTRISSRRCDKVGRRAGCQKSDGYRTIRVLGFSCLEHRLAFLYMTGRWPTGYVDHVNRDPADNRYVNLRECSNAENLQNKRGSEGASSKYIGVSFHRGRSRWQATIGLNGKRKFLGWFESEACAADAYKQAKSELHTFHSEVIQ